MRGMVVSGRAHAGLDTIILCLGQFRLGRSQAELQRWVWWVLQEHGLKTWPLTWDYGFPEGPRPSTYVYISDTLADMKSTSCFGRGCFQESRGRARCPAGCRPACGQPPTGSHIFLRQPYSIFNYVAVLGPLHYYIGQGYPLRGGPQCTMVGVRRTC